MRHLAPRPRFVLAALLLAAASACEIAPDRAPEENLAPDTSRPPPCDITGPAPTDVVFDTGEADFGTCPGAGEACGLDCLGGLARERCACSGTLTCTNDAPMCLGPRGDEVALPFQNAEACGNGLDDDCDGAVDEGCGGSCP